MSSTPLSTEQILAMLASAPPRIAAAAAGLTPAQLRTPPSEGEWSANDVLAHMRACADMWGRSILTILNEERPTIRAINPGTWIKQTNYPDLEFQPSLEAYTSQRTELLTILQPLTPEDWSRGATVTGAGKPLQRTVRFYAQWLATHERPHLKQIERAVKQLM